MIEQHGGWEVVQFGENQELENVDCWIEVVEYLVAQYLHLGILQDHNTECLLMDHLAVWK